MVLSDCFVGLEINFKKIKIIFDFAKELKKNKNSSKNLEIFWSWVYSRDRNRKQSLYFEFFLKNSNENILKILFDWFLNWFLFVFL